jgi:Rrf2 family protein
MMKLSPAAELAVRGVCVLAEHNSPDPLRLDSICSERDLPREYLAKIFTSLARANLVIPIRGKKGGYRLSREPGEINLLEIIEAVEGPLALNFCQQDPPQCDEEDCPIRPVWSELQQILSEKLSRMTLADCVRTNGSHAVSGQMHA